VKTAKSPSQGKSRKKSGPLCMGKSPAHGPPHTKTVPPQQLSDTSTFARTKWAQVRSVVLCRRGVRLDAWELIPASPGACLTTAWLGGVKSEAWKRSMLLSSCQPGALTATTPWVWKGESGAEAWKHIRAVVHSRRPWPHRRLCLGMFLCLVIPT
jgi:hypothetical protein